MEGIGISGSDALKIIDNASDSQFDEFSKMVVKGDDLGEVGRHRYLKTVTNSTAYEKAPLEVYKPLRDVFNDSIRSKIWKKVAEFADSNGNPRGWSESNLTLIRSGKAPYGIDGQAMNIHHIKPLSWGGNNDLSNLQIMTYTEHFKINHGQLHKPPFSGASNLADYGVNTI